MAACCMCKNVGAVVERWGLPLTVTQPLLQDWFSPTCLCRHQCFVLDMAFIEDRFKEIELLVCQP